MHIPPTVLTRQPTGALRPATIRLLLYMSTALLEAAVIAGSLMTWARIVGGPAGLAREMGVGWIAGAVFFLVAAWRQSYSHRTLTNLQAAWSRLTAAAVLSVALMLAGAAALQLIGDYSRLVFAGGWLTGWLLVLSERALLISWIGHHLGHRIHARVLIRDGEGVAAPDGWRTLDAGEDELGDLTGDPFLLHRLAAELSHVDDVVVACPPERRPRWSTVLKGLGVNGQLLCPELGDVGLLKPHADVDWPLLRVSVGPLSLRDRMVKRAFDLAVTVPLVVVATPVLLLVALAVQLDSPGPVLFRQVRVGRQNRMFSVLKFRSMHDTDADRDGAVSTGRGDPRVTRVGRLLRATSLDELPQLLNVVAGDMSLVGPRPHALASRAGDELFWEVDHLYWTRHSVKPGITGLAQVRGFRGATHQSSDLVDRLRSDLEYVNGWSLWRDVAILAKTVFVVVHGNAY